MMKFLLFVLVSLCLGNVHGEEDDVLPTVTIVLLVRNKAHILPYTLKLIQDLDYPKKRMSLFIHSDYNEDETLDALKSWIKSVGDEYHKVEFHGEEGGPSEFPGADGPNVWTDARYRHLMVVKEKGVAFARSIWSDFVWFLDADVLLTQDQILRELVSHGETRVITAPMLRTLSRYSNFWAGMSNSYYYARLPLYDTILERKQLGCFEVPMVHSAVLVNLNTMGSLKLTHIPEEILDYDGPEDDIIAFALSAHFNDIPMFICNNYNYGYTTNPMEPEQKLEADYENFRDLQLQIVADIGPLEPHPELKDFVVGFIKLPLDVDKVYMINLERRPDRKAKMEACFDLLGLNFEYVEGLDGRTLNDTFLAEEEITMMADFIEPFHGRPVTFGEIGCFLTHHKIWLDIIENKYQSVVVFEDDIRFEPDFRRKFVKLQKEIEKLALEWDLIYLGRKILQNVTEPWVDESDLIVVNGYTYWTLSYMITLEGAKKLVEEKPLEKLIPVDEYLPIMYNRHPNQTWMNHYNNRDLKAFSVHPLLVHPTHYTGEEGYFSDTEETPIISVKGEDREEL